MAITYLTCLDCRNCQKPIVLRASRRLEKLDDLPWWPKGNDPLIFLCPECKRVSRYWAASPEVREIDETQDQYGCRKHQAVFYTQIECASTGCSARLKVYV